MLLSDRDAETNFTWMHILTRLAGLFRRMNCTSVLRVKQACTIRATRSLSRSQSRLHFLFTLPPPTPILMLWHYISVDFFLPIFTWTMWNLLSEYFAQIKFLGFCVYASLISVHIFLLTTLYIMQNEIII